MQMSDMILVSVDDHVCEPSDMWERHVPAKWKSRAPRLVHSGVVDHRERPEERAHWQGQGLVHRGRADPQRVAAHGW